MASYKVPQDVEADDKLLGPFSFRQFLYLMTAFGFRYVSLFALFQIFPSLPLFLYLLHSSSLSLLSPSKRPTYGNLSRGSPFVLLLNPTAVFGSLAKATPTILITAPKKSEKTVYVISLKEKPPIASHSSLLSSTPKVKPLKNAANSSMRDEFYAEAYNTTDMFDQSGTNRLNHMISQDQQERREEVINQMRTAIEQSEYNFDRPAPMVQLPGQRVIQPLNNYNPNAQTIVQPSATPYNFYLQRNRPTRPKFHENRRPHPTIPTQPAITYP